MSELRWEWIQQSNNERTAPTYFTEIPVDVDHFKIHLNVLAVEKKCWSVLGDHNKWKAYTIRDDTKSDFPEAFSTCDASIGYRKSNLDVVTTQFVWTGNEISVRLCPSIEPIVLLAIRELHNNLNRYFDRLKTRKSITVWKENNFISLVILNCCRSKSCRAFVSYIGYIKSFKF